MSYELGDFLKSARGDLSLREVSKRTEEIGHPISHSMISSIEKGINARGNEFKPTPDDLETLSKIYHLNFLKLMTMAGYLPFKLAGTPKIKNAVPMPELNTKVNVYGSIRAGSPTFAQQEIIGEVVVSDKVQQKYGKKNLFALMVKGNSMNRKVPEGTVAIFAKEAAIENGDIVAVLIDGQDATIKQYRETSMAVIFQPMSYDEKFSPIIVPKRGEQDFRILGKMVYFVSGDYI